MLSLLFLFVVATVAEFDCTLSWVDALARQSRAETLATLESLCAADADCARVYFTASTPHAFRYLTRRWLFPFGAQNDTSTLAVHARRFCSRSSDNERDLWLELWTLRARVEQLESRDARCGANEQFVLSLDTMEGQCVCAEEHNCLERDQLLSLERDGRVRLAASTPTLSTVALTLASVAVLLFVGLRAITTGMLLRRLMRRHVAH